MVDRTSVCQLSWCDNFIATIVREWVREVEFVAVAAILEPHCAYSAFIHGTKHQWSYFAILERHCAYSVFIHCTKHRWSYFARTTSCTAEQLQHLEMPFPVPCFQPSLDSPNFHCFHYLQNREALGFHILRHLQHTNEPHLLWSLLDWRRPLLLSKASIAKMEKQ